MSKVRSLPITWYDENTEYRIEMQIARLILQPACEEECSRTMAAFHVQTAFSEELENEIFKCYYGVNLHERKKKYD